MRETFIKRYIVERTNKADIRLEEQSEKAESLWNEIQLKEPQDRNRHKNRNKEWASSVGLCQKHKPTELARSLLFCSCVYLSLYGPFNCISFHKFSRQLSVFSLCSSGLISALLVLSTVLCHFMKVSFSPDIIPSD